MSGLRIVLPVKPLRKGKSRLAARLGARARLRLNRDLLERSLEVLTGFAGGAAVLVVSRDAEVLAAAAAAGAKALAERGNGGLNAALRQASEVLEGEALLVIPVDLPLLSGADLARFVASAGAEREVALAPDRAGRGTNALLVRPPGIVPFRFGPDSLVAHLREARRRGIEPRIVRRAGLAFDLDGAADYHELRRRPETAAMAPVAARERRVEE